MIEVILSKALDKLGRKWKTILGLFSMLMILILSQLSWITMDQTNDWWKFAEMIFVIGVTHKVIKNGNK